jgi:MarR family transcriptional regulator, organic hydroperoxide resistance regulator
MTLQPLPRPQVDELLFQFLKYIYRWEREIYARFALDYQEIYLLQHLRRSSPARVSDIAAELQIPLFQTTRLVNKLAERGFLSKQKEADDRRAVLVSLQPKGETILRKVEDNNYQIISANAGELTEEQVRSALLTASDIGRILRIPGHE